MPQRGHGPPFNNTAIMAGKECISMVKNLNPNEKRKVMTFKLGLRSMISKMTADAIAD